MLLFETCCAAFAAAEIKNHKNPPTNPVHCTKQPPPAHCLPNSRYRKSNPRATSWYPTTLGEVLRFAWMQDPNNCATNKKSPPPKDARWWWVGRGGLPKNRGLEIHVPHIYGAQHSVFGSSWPKSTKSTNTSHKKIPGHSTTTNPFL